MQLEHTVYVYIPGTSPASLGLAMNLARRAESTLEVISVIDDPTRLWQRLFDDKEKVRRILEEVRKERIAEIKSLVPEAEDLPIHVAVGHPLEEIVKYVAQRKADLLIKCGLPEPGGASSLMGPLALKLLRYCPCPVLISHANQQSPFRQVVAAVDPLPDIEAGESPDLCILNAALTMAQLDAAQLHVFNCWDFVGERMLMGSRLSMDAMEMNQLLVNVRDRHERSVRHLVQQAIPAGIAVKQHIERGQPQEIIPGLTHKLKMDLAVMGTVGRSGLSGLLLGNTAEAVLRTLNCSLLAVKPEGFKSPLLKGN